MQKLESQALSKHYDEFSGQIRSIGSWSFSQNLLYVIFLQKNKLIMISKRKRRNLRIFDRMAEFIPTRNSLQCRSHHQKLFQKFGDVQAIISNFKKYISKEQYKNKFDELTGGEKAKEKTDSMAKEVKEQVLSQAAEQLQVKVQDNALGIIQPKVEEIQNIYSDYLEQLERQLNDYPLANFYFPALQNLS